MRSKASFKGHPIHPMLVTFPFAFLTGGWAFGMAGAIAKKRDLNTVARYLVPTGVAAGLLAAVPGIIDYVHSVPPESSAKERATKHAMINSTAMALFASMYFIGQTVGVALAAPVVDGAGPRMLFLVSAALLPALAFWFTRRLKAKVL